MLMFAKWQGLGNDFVMCQAPAGVSLEAGGALARRLCSRHLGVGADGLIFALPGVPGESLLTMEIFNADGSLAMMCGNGIRCLAAWAVEQGWAEAGSFAVSTRSGVKNVSVRAGAEAGLWQVEVDMGCPGIIGDGLTEIAEGLSCPYRIISMGNLHRVVMNGAPEAARTWLPFLDVDGVGARLEPSAAGECNVEFLTVAEAGRLQVRVRERGVGETLACGTGACAALAAASLQGLCPRRAAVCLPGGELDITWGDDGHVYMRGPAASVFTGTAALR